MLKILRKYRGPAIAAGGTLLMVAFLVPEVVKQMQGDPGKRIIAEVGGRSISAREMVDADAEYTALKMFYEPLVVDTLRIKDGTHWYLLSQEAARAGLVGQPANGEQWISDLSQLATVYAIQVGKQRQDINAYIAEQDPQKRAELTQQWLQRLTHSRLEAASRNQLTLEKFDTALAKARGILDMRIAFNGAARYSDAGAISSIKKLTETAVVDYVSIPAEKALGQVEEPTEAELKAHFEQYKDTKPGAGLFGFGYVLPPRFQIEYLKLDRAQIQTAIKLDPIDVSKFYSRNRDKYKGEFAVEKTNVENDLRDQKVNEVLADADRVVRTEVGRATRKLESDGPYKKLPTDWSAQRPKFESIAAAIVDNIKSTQKLTLPLPPVTIKGSEWLSAEQIAALPEIGATQARVGNHAESLPQLLLQTRQIAGNNDLGLQTGVPFIESPITDARQNRYYVTILDAKPEASAASLDEVRATVIHDVKLQKAYLKLLGDVNAQQVLAATGGVKSVADLYNAQTPPTPDSPAVQPQFTQRVAALGQLRPEIDTAEFRSSVLKAFEALDPLKEAKDQDNLLRTLVIGLPSKRAVVVAQITELRPVTQETYRRTVDTQYTQLQNYEYNKVAEENKFKIEDPFSPDAVKARLSYIDRRNDDKSKAKGKS